jgi:hypothetical protein
MGRKGVKKAQGGFSRACFEDRQVAKAVCQRLLLTRLGERVTLPSRALHAAREAKSSDAPRIICTLELNADLLNRVLVRHLVEQDG